MLHKTLLLAISLLGILALTACDSGSTQPIISTATATSVAGQSTPTDTSSQSSAQQLFVSISTTTTQNSTSISVHTIPGAAITIGLSYCNHSSTQTHHADSAGDYTLHWTPDTKCGGTATATVTASANGQSSTSSTSFSVS